MVYKSTGFFLMYFLCKIFILLKIKNTKEKSNKNKFKCLMFFIFAKLTSWWVVRFNFLDNNLGNN